MVWRRLPTFFPNIRLQMLPLSKEQHTQLLDTGWLREVAFKTEPRANKLEIKAFLEAVHGMEVERVSTINYQGKRKRQVDAKGKPSYLRLSDWKKAYVIFRPPPDIQAAWEEAREARRAAAAEAAAQRQWPGRLRELIPTPPPPRREWRRQQQQQRLHKEQQQQQEEGGDA